jgi:hypothetical protein
MDYSSFITAFGFIITYGVISFSLKVDFLHKARKLLDKIESPKLKEKLKQYLYNNEKYNIADRILWKIRNCVNELENEYQNIIKWMGIGCLTSMFGMIIAVFFEQEQNFLELQEWHGRIILYIFIMISLGNYIKQFFRLQIFTKKCRNKESKLAKVVNENFKDIIIDF